MISISPISSLFAQSLNYQPRSPRVKMAFNSYQQLSLARRRGPDPPVWVNSGFLNFDTTDTWDQIILCRGWGRGWKRLFYAFKVFGSIPGLQPQNDSSNPPMWQSEMPPDCTPFENHWIKHTPPTFVFPAALLCRCPERIQAEGLREREWGVRTQSLNWHSVWLPWWHCYNYDGNYNEGRWERTAA